MVGGPVGVGLVEHALVAVARRAGLVGVDARDDEDLFGDALLDAAEAGNVVDDGVFAVRGARPDDEEEAGGGAREDVADGIVVGGLAGGQGVGEGIGLLEGLGGGHLGLEDDIHGARGYTRAWEGSQAGRAGLLKRFRRW